MRKVNFVNGFDKPKGYDFGYFHQWMNEVLTDPDGNSYSVTFAIVELPDGSMQEVGIHFIQFAIPNKAKP